MNVSIEKFVVLQRVQIENNIKFLTNLNPQWIRKQIGGLSLDRMTVEGYSFVPIQQTFITQTLSRTLA